MVFISTADIILDGLLRGSFFFMSHGKGRGYEQ